MTTTSIDTAIVNGDIEEPKETSISSNDARGHRVCIGDESDSEEASWQIIDDKLEGQSAVTIWRAIKRWPLENARNNTVTLVELKPKSGRYHQLRRHMVGFFLFWHVFYQVENSLVLKPCYLHRHG